MAVLVISKVSILAILPPFKGQAINGVTIFGQVINRVRKIADFGHELGREFADLDHK